MQDKKITALKLHSAECNPHYEANKLKGLVPTIVVWIGRKSYATQVQTHAAIRPGRRLEAAQVRAAEEDQAKASVIIILMLQYCLLNMAFF